MFFNQPRLFESNEVYAAVEEPENQDWISVIKGVSGIRFDMFERRFYLALKHLRKQQARPALPDQKEIEAESKQEAFECMLEALKSQKEETKEANEAEVLSERKTEILVDALACRQDDDLPASLKDFSVEPPSLRSILAGAGRPPCDALCLLRAFLVAPLHGVGDGPTSVFLLLRRNPILAYLCGFEGAKIMKKPGQLTSRRLPSRSVCEEFSEVMTRYGLWHLVRVEQVAENFEKGVVEIEDCVVFDTTHVEANSNCGKIVPEENNELKKQPAKKRKKRGKKRSTKRQRKVPLLRKRCACGKENWEGCSHPWSPTDNGAAVVVKGPTKIFWAHKASVVGFASSEIPFDIRVCRYGASGDGKTLVPHLELLQRDFSQVIAEVSRILADTAYRGNIEEVKRFGREAQLLTPVFPRKIAASVAAKFNGIERFTPLGVPVCAAGHHFELRGRDILEERYIWVAPDAPDGNCVCAGCPHATTCLKKKAVRRNIRVDRTDLPQIDWENPQFSATNQKSYRRRTAIERAIKRLKVDLKGGCLTHRDAFRVQAHFDRKLLTLHLLLATEHSPA